MRKYYVYYLINPIDNLVFYIGKGFGDRMYKHYKNYRKGLLKNSNLRNKIETILENNMDIIYLKVFETFDEKEAYLFEKNEIDKIGLDNLTNIVPGGVGGFFSISMSEKVSQSLRKSEKFQKSLRSKERIEKLKIANTGKNNPMYGKNITEEHKKIIIEINSKPKSEEHKLNISKSLKGKSKSKEHCENVSKALKNSEIFQRVIKSNEYRQKISNAVKGDRNPRALTIKFISPNGEEFIIKGGFDKFVKDNNLSRNKMIDVKNGKLEHYNNWKCFVIYDNLNLSNTR